MRLILVAILVFAATAFTATFPECEPPYLAIVTERCSCDSDTHLEAAFQSLHSAVSSNAVDLVSVRVNVVQDDSEKRTKRVERLIQGLLDWSGDYAFRVVVSSDWLETGIRTGAHGIHFKEIHRHKIAEARRLSSSALLIGTSTHSVESALEALRYDVDYLFCGTCFPTESHPERTVVEGPALPAEVKAALTTRKPRVLSIGGMDASNCGPQVHQGFFVANSRSDGVATIRSVLQAPNPAETARTMKQAMLEHVQASSLR